MEVVVEVLHLCLRDGLLLARYILLGINIRCERRHLGSVSLVIQIHLDI